MKAVIVGGDEGTGLHPISLEIPKPMVPLLGCPVIEHLLGLLRTHNITEICITLRQNSKIIMDYFGNGSRFGVQLTYLAENAPLGTAGGVRQCLAALGGEELLVLSGDIVCDFDLTKVLQFHQDRKADATLLLYTSPSPLEYGLVVTEQDGRVVRLIEKPAWGQVVTNLVNTGIYILSPGVLEQIPTDQPYDFETDLFPKLLSAGAKVYGWEGTGYWRDLGSCAAYLDCTVDILEGRVKLDPGLPQRAPGIWSAQPIPEHATLVPPCWLGEGVQLAEGALIGPHVVLEPGASVGARSLVQRSILFPGAVVEEGATLYGAIMCRDARAGRDSVLNKGAVLGNHALAEPGSVLMEGVRLWPGRKAPARSRLARSITAQGQQGTLRFSEGGIISGFLGEDLGPEALMAIGSALGLEGNVGLGHWGGAGAGMLAQAAASGITAAGGTALSHHMECAAQAAWLAQTHQLTVSLFIQQEGEYIRLHFFDRDGLALGRAREQKLERTLLQGECRRVSAGGIGQQEILQTGPASYVGDVVKRGALHRRFLRALKIAVPGDSPADRAMAQALAQLGCRVVRDWKKGVPAFFAKCGGLSLSAQDEQGALLTPAQLLPLVCLIEMENGCGRVAVPDGASAAVELVAAGLDGTALRLGKDGPSARTLYASLPWLRDAAFAAVRICSRMALTGETLTEMISKTPRFSARKREIPLSSDRGAVMRVLSQEYGRESTGEGLRIRADNGWIYLVPLARRSMLRVVAESPDMELAAELCDLYAGRCARTDRALTKKDKK